MNARPRQSGVVIVYAAVFLVALCAIVSLAVDWGRVQTAKTEMQDAADAAARFAAAGLTDNTYLAKAQSAAVQNSVDGSTLTLLAADVETGTWDLTTHAFVLNGTPKNTVRVTGYRTQARGNAVPLVFGRVIGANTCDVKAVSVARQSSLAAVGIDSITMGGNATIRRKTSEGGGVTVASNGPITMGSSASIAGDVLYRTTAPTGTISGNKTPLPSDFTYAVSAIPGGTTNYSSIAISSGNNPVAGNIYCSGDVAVSGSTIITLYSDSNIYIGGNLAISGNVSVVTNGYRIYFHLVGTGSASVSNTNPLPMAIYAPAGSVSLGGAGTITGSVVGKTLTMTSNIDYTAALPIPASPGGGNAIMAAGGVMTVK